MDWNFSSMIFRRLTLNLGAFFVGEYGTAKAALDVEGTNGVGTIRSRELDFEQVADNERRPVFADKDGILRVSTTSNYYQSYNFSSRIDAARVNDIGQRFFDGFAFRFVGGVI